MNTTLQSMGDLLCELMTKLLIENGHYAVFDFRDLSGHFAQSDHGHGNSAPGPDLLMSVRLGQVVNLLEVGVAVRRVTDGRIIWTQSLAADVSDGAMFDGRRLSEFVNQAIEAIESWLMRHRDTDVHNASRLTLAATHHIMSLSTGDLTIAEGNLRTAQDLAPSAVRLAWMAMLEAIRFGESTGHDRQAQVERIRALTAEALEFDRGNSLALALLGHANAYVVRDFAMAAELIADALEINPSRAEAWDAQAMLSIYTGDPVRGYEAARRAKALGRFSPYAFWYEASCGIGATLAGWHQEAVRHGELVLRRRPDFQPTIRHLVASYALAGDMDKARDMYAALRALQPDFCPAQLRDPAYPAGSPESLTLIEAGLKAANVAL